MPRRSPQRRRSSPPSPRAAPRRRAAGARLAAGGRHALAVLAYGAAPVAPRDVIVGPGNRSVTAAKQLVAGSPAIDLLAGPSELTVLADGAADPERVAADLLAQAEHDPAAVPLLVTTDPGLAERVDAALARQLNDLATAAVARAALANGGVIAVAGIDERIPVCDA